MRRRDVRRGIVDISSCCSKRSSRSTRRKIGGEGSNSQKEELRLKEEELKYQYGHTGKDYFIPRHETDESSGGRENVYSRRRKEV